VACPAMIFAGILLVKKKSQGWVAGAGLLLSYGFLVLSAVIILLYQSYNGRTGMDISDIAVLLIMAGICFWQFVLFMKAALNKNEN